MLVLLELNLPLLVMRLLLKFLSESRRPFLILELSVTPGSVSISLELSDGHTQLKLA